MARPYVQSCAPLRSEYVECVAHLGSSGTIQLAFLLFLSKFVPCNASLCPSIRRRRSLPPLGVERADDETSKNQCASYIGDCSCCTGRIMTAFRSARLPNCIAFISIVISRLRALDPRNYARISPPSQWSSFCDVSNESMFTNVDTGSRASASCTTDVRNTYVDEERFRVPLPPVRHYLALCARFFEHVLLRSPPNLPCGTSSAQKICLPNDKQTQTATKAIRRWGCCRTLYAAESEGGGGP
jgi:hypothetical protein